MSLTIRRAVASDHPALLRFFEASKSLCYCHYHDFRGDGRDWQGSLVTSPEIHAKALAEGLASGTITALISVEGERIVGWMRFGSPAGNRQYKQRIYKELPCFSGSRARIASVYCFLVDPELRRRGIARSLLAELLKEGETFGFEAIEGLPRGAVDVMAEELWTGPLALFDELGFDRVHDFAPYPVVRRSLGPRDEQPVPGDR